MFSRLSCASPLIDIALAWMGCGRGKMMAKIVILGSGFAGLTAAVRLNRRLPDARHEVLVIDRSTTFVYRPSLVLVAFGHKPARDVTFDLVSTYHRLRIPFLHAEVKEVEPQSKTVLTSHGPIAYDKLIVAMGEKLAVEEVPGMAEYGHNVCSLRGAMRLKEALETWNGGPTVIGWSQFVQTGGPAFEVAVELRRWMTKRGWNTPIHFIDPLPKIWAPAGPEASQFMQQLFDDRQIVRHGPVQVQAVECDRVVLTNGEVLPSTLTIVTPPFRGVEAQRSIAGNHKRDWLETGRDMQSVQFPDIYVTGSATAFEGPKQAHTAMMQAEIAVDNVVVDLQRAPSVHREYAHEMSCVLDLGQGQGLFVKKSLWSDDHQVARVGRQWPVAKAALAYTYVKTPVFKRWGFLVPQ